MRTQNIQIVCVDTDISLFCQLRGEAEKKSYSNNKEHTFPDCSHFYCMRVGVLPACTSVHHTHAVPSESRRGCQTPGVTDGRELQCVLRIESESSAKVTRFLTTEPSLQPLCPDFSVQYQP